MSEPSELVLLEGGLVQMKLLYCCEEKANVVQMVIRSICIFVTCVMTRDLT